MVSAITAADLAEFLGIDEPDAEEVRAVESLMKSAAAFIGGFTGLTAEEIDERPDLDFAFKVLVQDMYDNRARYVERATLNQTVESILNMHRVNFL